MQSEGNVSPNGKEYGHCITVMFLTPTIVVQTWLVEKTLLSSTSLCSYRIYSQLISDFYKIKMGSKGNRFDIEEDVKRDDWTREDIKQDFVVYNCNWCSGTSLRVLKEPTLKVIK